MHYRYGIFDNENPSYLAWEEPNLYVLHELDEEVKLSTYSYFKGPISIFKSNEASIKGADACHMYTTPDMAYIFVSCYGSGHLHVYSKKDKAFINTFTPDDNHNEVARAHGSIITNSGKWLLTVDLGRDYIRVLIWIRYRSSLVEHSNFSLPQGSGPRQVILSKEDRYIYCMNELNNSIMILSFDNATGEVTELMDTIQASEQDVNAVGTSILTKIIRFLCTESRPQFLVAI